MASDYLSNPKYRDWLKGGLATKILRSGVVDLVDETSKEQYDAMLADIKMRFGAEAIAGCTICTLGTLKPLHSKDRDGNCGLGQRQHCNCLNTYGKQLCPTNFCSAMYDKIIEQHRFKSPNWKNTDIRQWHCNHWQIAKCNIPTRGYVAKVSAMDTDTSGLMSVIINDLKMQNKFDSVIDPPEDIFSKVREARNAIFHSPESELEEHTLRIYINDMISILLDKKALRGRPEALSAKEQLKQLRDKKLEITVVDEMEIRKLSLEAIKEMEQEVLQKLEDKRNEILLKFNSSVLQNINAQLTKLQERQPYLSTRVEYDRLKSYIESIEEQVKSVKDGLIAGNKQDTEINRIQDQVEELNRKLDKVVTVNEFRQQIEEIHEQLSILSNQLEELQKSSSIDEDIAETSLESTDSLINTSHFTLKLSQELMEVRQEFNKFKRTTAMYVQTQRNHEKQIELFSQKQALQCDLIAMYQKYKTKTSVIPTMPEEEVDVTEIYEKPNMVVVDSTFTKSKKDGTATGLDSHSIQTTYMYSYKEMFGQGEKRNIYISGDAGMGKSTFCKHLIKQWCKTHQGGSKENSVQIFEDPEVLGAFEYLFCLTLCHMSYEYHVHSMIKTHLLTSSHYKEMFDKIVETESEKCLIILDGLDEWTPVGADVNKYLRGSKLPQRDLMKKYTILTTSRPWKIEEARLKTTDIDIHARVHGLTNKSSNQFIGSVVHYLNVKFGRFKNDSDFLRILTYHGLLDMKSVPVVLLQLICLWHDDKPLGNSLCDTYSNMIDLFFKVTKFEQSETVKMCSKQLPKCFHDNVYCQKYKGLLFKMAEFSFKTLFPEDCESSLVFDRSVAHKCGMTPDDIDFSLKIGLLTESKIAGISASDRLTSLSFLHQTFQEFLAAVFISVSYPVSKEDNIGNDNEDTDSVIENQLFQTCKSISAILEMEKFFIFVSGMNPNVAKQLSKRIQIIVGSNEDVKQYREDLHRNQLVKGQYDKVFSELKQVCNLVTSCVEEILNGRSYMTADIDSCMYLSDLICDNEDNVQQRVKESQLKCLLCIDTEFMESVYITGDSDVLQKLLGIVTKCTSLKKLQVQDLLYDSDSMKVRFSGYLLKLGYDLSVNSRNTLVHSSWELGSNGNSLNMLFQKDGHMINPKKMVLNMQHAPYKHTDFENVVSKLPVLTEVFLVDTYCTEHRLGSCPLKVQLPGSHPLQSLVLENLYLNGINIPTSLPNLELVSLNNFDLSHSDLENIVCLVQNASKLKEIHLERLNCADHEYGECSFIIQLRVHKSLQCVDLQYVPFNASVNQAALKHVCIKESNVETSLLEGLAHAQSLESLVLSQTERVPFSPPTAKVLTHILPNFLHLQKLELISINFANTVPELSSKMQTLKCVVLRSCTMTENAFNAFLGSIPNVKHKLRIDLDVLLSNLVVNKSAKEERIRLYVQTGLNRIKHEEFLNYTSERAVSIVY